MKKAWIAIIISVGLCHGAFAQNTKKDSAEVAKTLLSLCNISKTVDIADPETTSQGRYYKAAPYIIYRGDDKRRNWKDFTNYSNADEKKRVDGICERINRTVNQDRGYRITRYFTETESEGTWHVLMITYKWKGADKTSAFAFLKIGNRFGLGDID